MKTNIVPFERKTKPAQNSQSDYQAFLYSAFFIAEFAEIALLKLMEANPHEIELLAGLGKHLAVIRNFITQ